MSKHLLRMGAAVLSTVLWAGAAHAQAPQGAAGGFLGEPKPVPGYVPPRIPAADIEALAKQPDFQGMWTYTTPDPQRMSVLADPANAFIPYEMPLGSTEFGARPGSYLTAIPYKPEYRKKYMDLVAETVAGRSIDTFAQCLPFAMPRFMAGALIGFDVMQHRDLMVMYNPYTHETRRIFTDGRGHPVPEGAEGSDARTWTGHSTGRWEGDTLVVETVNLLEGYFDMTSAMHSNQMRIVERIRLIGPDAMEDQITVEDPVMFTGPWVFTRYYRRVPVRAGELQPGVRGSTDTGSYRYRELWDRPCTPIDMSKGYQSIELPQEKDQKAKKAPAGRKR